MLIIIQNDNKIDYIVPRFQLECNKEHKKRISYMSIFKNCKQVMSEKNNQSTLNRFYSLIKNCLSSNYLSHKIFSVANKIK